MQRSRRRCARAFLRHRLQKGDEFSALKRWRRTTANSRLLGLKELRGLTTDAIDENVWSSFFRLEADVRQLLAVVFPEQTNCSGYLSRIRCVCSLTRSRARAVRSRA